MKKSKILLTIALLSFLFAFASAQNVGDVMVRFCNDGQSTKNLSMVLDAGEQGDICMEFGNGSDRDVVIKYGFVDGTIAVGDQPKKACKNEGDITKFGQYVTADFDTITIPGKQAIRQTAHIKFPGGFSGMVNGCLTYYVDEVKDNPGDSDSMVSVLVRKASFIDVLVGGQVKRNINLPTQGAVTSYYDSDLNSLMLKLILVNSGNVDEIVSITGAVSNSFGFTKDIEMSDIKVLSDQESQIDIEVKDIPWYKMWYKAELNIVSTPSFVFDVSSLPDDIKQPIIIKTETSLFIIPWMLLCCLGGFIILIIVIRFFVKHLHFN